MGLVGFIFLYASAALLDPSRIDVKPVVGRSAILAENIPS
jgi:hypothetical protein